MARVQLYKDNAFNGDKGTLNLSLKTNDMIVGYELEVVAKNGATNNDFNGVIEKTIVNSITNIEISSGSAVFKKYSGKDCRTISLYRDGRLPPQLITGVAGGTNAGNNDPSLGWQGATFKIDFCTRQDPLGTRTGIIFPAPLFNNLQMTISYDFTVSATAGFVSGASYHMLNLFAITRPTLPHDEMLRKFILVEAKKADHVTLAQGDLPFSLTKDPLRRLRQLFVCVYEPGIGEGIHIPYMTLRKNGGNNIPTTWGNLQAENASDCHLNFKKVYYCDPTSTSTAHWTEVPAAQFQAVSLESTTTPWVSQVGDTLTVTHGSGEKYQLEVTSDVIPGTAVVDLDKDGTGMDMISCAKDDGTNDLDLNITQGNADGVMRVLEQHVSKVWGNN